MGSGMCQGRCPQKLNHNKKQVVIGAHSFRGCVHVCRLLCEYMKVNYRNQFYDPYTWQIFKNRNTSEWLFSDLPYLRDGKFIVTQTNPICQYLIKKEGRDDLLGRTIEDKIEVDKFLYGKSLAQGILSLIVEYKDKLHKLHEDREQIWIKNISPILNQYEKKAKFNEFYLGYLSIIDFIISEAIGLIYKMYTEKMQNYPKLLAIKSQFEEIPEIKQYQISDRTVKNLCPLQFVEQWKHSTLFKK